MRMLDENMNLDSFYQRLAQTRRRVLLLDYDGTLAPFRVQRRRALPYPGVRRVLGAITRAPRGRVVVVSGRTVAEVLYLLQPHSLLEVWGCHGAQRMRPDGTWQKMRLDRRSRLALSQGEQWARDMGWGGQLEIKPFSIALHWRGLEDDVARDMSQAARSQWSRLGPQAGVEVLDFDGGLELRASGVHKGWAVRTILEEEGADACLAYLGDDLTDEDAFQAIKGHGLGVLVRDQLRSTQADLWLRPPEELLEFLQTWQRAGQGEQPGASWPLAESKTQRAR